MIVSAEVRIALRDNPKSSRAEDSVRDMVITALDSGA
jgi:hypothetical protein